MQRTIFCLLILLGSFVFGQAVAFQWTDTFKVQSTGIRQTAPFKSFCKEWRVKVSPNGKPPFSAFIVNLTNGGSSVLSRQYQGGFSVSESTSFTSENTIHYMRVFGSDQGWTATIEQYLDKPGEWQARKWRKNGVKIEPYGSWSGAKNDQEMLIDIPEKMGRFTITQLGIGRLSVEIKLDGGETIGKWVTVNASKNETWFYVPGTYRVIISAIDCSWQMNVETAQF